MNPFEPDEEERAAQTELALCREAIDAKLQLVFELVDARYTGLGIDAWKRASTEELGKIGCSDIAWTSRSVVHDSECWTLRFRYPLPSGLKVWLSIDLDEAY